MRPSDLEYNRRGLLGPAQRAALQALCDKIDSVGTFGLKFGPAAGVARAFVEPIRQALEDGRVMGGVAEVGLDHPAFRAGLGARRVYADPVNYESGYFAAVDGGGRFKLAPWLGLLPGRYQVYVAPWAGYVVGASPLPPFDHAQSHFVALCAAQSLSAETLAENRRGRMTEAQQRSLRRGNKKTSLRDLIPGYTLGAIFFAYQMAYILGYVHVRAGRSHVPLAVAVCVCLGFVFVLVTYLLATEPRDHRKRLLEIQEGLVAKIEGQLSKELFESRHFAWRYFTIGARGFGISHRPKLYVTLVPGCTYRAYFAPRSGQFLAIEYLRPGKLS